MSQSARGTYVVVADDDAGVLHAVSMLLRSKGYDVRCATDGGEAITMITHQPPDAAVLDIDMPIVSGLEVARRVRATPEAARLRLIAMTGSADLGMHAECLKAGFNAVCWKPFGASTLLEALAPGPAASTPMDVG